MRAVIQRSLTEASVESDGKITGKIDKGLVVLLGIEDADTDEDINWLARKIVSLRIFNNNEGKMNLSLLDIGGDILLISQFTLHANVKKGNRPSFIKAGSPEYANKMYLEFADHLRKNYGLSPGMGVFGGYMKVKLVNDGPVTIFIDSKNRDI